MAFRFFPQNYQFTDDDGSLLAGGFVYFYTTETSSPKDTFADRELSIPNPNPIELDFAARLESDAWGDGTYRVKVTDSLGATVGTPLDDVIFGDVAEVDLTGYVDLTTDQTIAGEKTFVEVTAFQTSPTMPTPAPGDNSTKGATTAFVTAAITAAAADYASEANQEAASPGYQVFPGGLTLQWGPFSVAAGASTTQAVTFPIPFPTAYIAGWTGVDNAATSQIGIDLDVPPTTTGMTLEKGDNDLDPRTGTWFALGH